MSLFIAVGKPQGRIYDETHTICVGTEKEIDSYLDKRRYILNYTEEKEKEIYSKYNPELYRLGNCKESYMPVVLEEYRSVFSKRNNELRDLFAWQHKIIGNYTDVEKLPVKTAELLCIMLDNEIKKIK